jgi:hypothetical protein
LHSQRRPAAPTTGPVVPGPTCSSVSAVAAAAAAGVVAAAVTLAAPGPAVLRTGCGRGSGGDHGDPCWSGGAARTQHYHHVCLRVYSTRPRGGRLHMLAARLRRRCWLRCRWPRALRGTHAGCQHGCMAHGAQLWAPSCTTARLDCCTQSQQVCAPLPHAAWRWGRPASVKDEMAALGRHRRASQAESAAVQAARLTHRHASPLGRLTREA